jgi:1,4-alpha-glucan branching enzyme
MKVARNLLWVLAITASVAGCGSVRAPVLDREPSPELVEGGAMFRYINSDAEKVYLVGDFNNWSPKSDPMKDLNGDGHWSLYYPLRPGEYQYKFIVDDRWIPDPLNPTSVPDGFGDINSVVKVPDVLPGA